MKNEPAFPQQEEYYTSDPVRSGTVKTSVKYPGMTIRDYFAAHASEKEIDEFSMIHNVGCVKARYLFADAMLEERNK